MIILIACLVMGSIVGSLSQIVFWSGKDKEKIKKPKPKMKSFTLWRG